MAEDVRITETNGPEETFREGKRLGEAAVRGQIFCLSGELGVGKTVFTQGFAAGLGITEPVNSPTFTILQEYRDGRIEKEPEKGFDYRKITVKGNIL